MRSFIGTTGQAFSAVATPPLFSFYRFRNFEKVKTFLCITIDHIVYIYTQTDMVSIINGHNRLYIGFGSCNNVLNQ